MRPLMALISALYQIAKVAQGQGESAFGEVEDVNPTRLFWVQADPCRGRKAAARADLQNILQNEKPKSSGVQILVLHGCR